MLLDSKRPSLMSHLHSLRVSVSTGSNTQLDALSRSPTLRESTAAATAKMATEAIQLTAEDEMDRFDGGLDDAASKARNFQDFLGIMLERGLVGFLSKDCILFVWDQGFISGLY